MTTTWLRRARPALGTLVEVGICATTSKPGAVFERIFEEITARQACLSRHEPDSDIARFDRLRIGEPIRLRSPTRSVLAAAHELQVASGGAFDVTLGTAPHGWRLDGELLWKLDQATRFDLGGIAKGHVVDMAVQALAEAGCPAGWVNAGGDLRVYGEFDLPVHLRDEVHGGVRLFLHLRNGAFATSCYGVGRPSRLSGAAQGRFIHASVAAPSCLWADALTKLAALAGVVDLPLLVRYEAVAWIH